MWSPTPYVHQPSASSERSPVPSTNAAPLVGEPEQVIGAQPRLHVLERDVVHRLAAGERMAEVREHLRARPA